MKTSLKFHYSSEGAADPYIEAGYAFQSSLERRVADLSVTERSEFLYQDRLAAALRLSRTNPMYAKLYSGKNPNEWDSLPIIDKIIVSKMFEDLVVSQGINRPIVEGYLAERFDLSNCLHDRYLAFESSGSSGHRSISVYNLFDFGRSLAAFYGMCMQPYVRNPARVAYVGLLDRYNGGNQWMYHLRGHANVALFDLFDDLEHLLHEISRFCPSVILTRPHLLRELGLSGKAQGRLTFKGAHLISVGEGLTPPDAQSISSCFETLPHNSFSTTETGPIGFQLDPDVESLTCYPALNYVEIVDESGVPITRFHEYGRIVVSNTYNTVMPLLRYDLGDQACWLPTDDGRPTMSFLMGRNSTVLKFKVDGSVFEVCERELAGFAVPGLANYQLHQTRPDALNIGYSVSFGGDPTHVGLVLEAEIRKLLKDNGALSISTEHKREIGPDKKTGKMRRIIPLS
ncbi:hypothetical protein [Bradyrhizobium prioriisuperbiae]|uniref:hypothetical protein n=1 Tax=Bradyrhizobium prioriisuperbiae TaxID=2854389 RepID=UPI0028EE6316|nr:hypothetical protein [Bradyrhizobium prioritasuperba]